MNGGEREGDAIAGSRVDTATHRGSRGDTATHRGSRGDKSGVDNVFGEKHTAPWNGAHSDDGAEPTEEQLKAHRRSKRKYPPVLYCRTGDGTPNSYQGAGTVDYVVTSDGTPVKREYRSRTDSGSGGGVDGTTPKRRGAKKRKYSEVGDRRSLPAVYPLAPHAEYREDSSTQLSRDNNYGESVSTGDGTVLSCTNNYGTEREGSEFSSMFGTAAAASIKASISAAISSAGKSIFTSIVNTTKRGQQPSATHHAAVIGNSAEDYHYDKLPVAATKLSSYEFYGDPRTGILPVPAARDPSLASARRATAPRPMCSVPLQGSSLLAAVASTPKTVQRAVIRKSVVAVAQQRADVPCSTSLSNSGEDSGRRHGGTAPALDGHHDEQMANYQDEQDQDELTFSECLADLASADFGARVLFSTNEYRSSHNAILNPMPPQVPAGRYPLPLEFVNGDWWLTQRRRKAGHDWCIIALAAPCIVRGLDIEMSYLTGLHAPFVSVEAAYLPNLQDDLAECIQQFELLNQKEALLKRSMYSTTTAHPLPNAKWKTLHSDDINEVLSAGRNRVVEEGSYDFSNSNTHKWNTLQEDKQRVILEIETLLEKEIKANHEQWSDLLPMTEMLTSSEDSVARSHNVFAVPRRQSTQKSQKYTTGTDNVPGMVTTHLRLNLFPDGGVSRFRVYGEIRIPSKDILKYSKLLPPVLSHRYSRVPVLYTDTADDDDDRVCTVEDTGSDVEADKENIGTSNNGVERDMCTGGGYADLLCAALGGVAMLCSDQVSGTPSNLLLRRTDPGTSPEYIGWCTARKVLRAPVIFENPSTGLATNLVGEDWAIFKLAHRGCMSPVVHTDKSPVIFTDKYPRDSRTNGNVLRSTENSNTVSVPVLTSKTSTRSQCKFVVDLSHLHGLTPVSFKLQVCDLPEVLILPVMDQMMFFKDNFDRLSWRTLVPPTALHEIGLNVFTEFACELPFTHVRFTISPDGGVHRLRLFAKLVATNGD